MSKNEQIEEKLFSNSDIDNLISQKIEEKIANEREKAKKIKCVVKVVITDFDKLPSNQTFSTKANYLVFNRKNGIESYINGIQAESIIGLNQEIRQRIIDKFADNFAVGDYYVKFNSYILEK